MCNLPERRDWQWKNWILLWWAWPCSEKLLSNYLLMVGVGLRQPSPEIFGVDGRFVVTSERAYTVGGLPGCYPQCPRPVGSPADPRPHRRPSNASKWVWSGLQWDHCSFALGLSVCSVSFVLSKTGVCFPNPVGVL